MYTENEIFSKVEKLVDKIHQNRELQQMAIDNGIDIKNSVKLTEASEDNYAISVIALMLAKDANDPKYRDLVRNGMAHRESRIDVINEYKDQANQLYRKYKARNFNESSNLSFYEESFFNELANCDDDDIVSINEMTQAYLKTASIYMEDDRTPGQKIMHGVAIGVGAVALLPLIVIIMLLTAIYKMITKVIDIFTDKRRIRYFEKWEAQLKNNPVGDELSYIIDKPMYYCDFDYVKPLIDKFKDLTDDEESIIKRTDEWAELQVNIKTAGGNRAGVTKEGSVHKIEGQISLDELRNIISNYKKMLQAIPELRETLKHFKRKISDNKARLEELRRTYKRDEPMKASFNKVDSNTLSSYLSACNEFSSGDIKKRSKVAEKAGKDLIQLIDTFTSFYDDIIKAVRRSAIKGNINFDSEKFANRFADELENL